MSSSSRSKIHHRKQAENSGLSPSKPSSFRLSKFGHYKLGRRLGRVNFAEVKLATHEIAKIKVLKQHFFILELFVVTPFLGERVSSDFFRPPFFCFIFKDYILH